MLSRYKLSLIFLVIAPLLLSFAPPPPCENVEYCAPCSSAPYCLDPCECPGVYGWPICLVGGHRFEFGPQVYYLQRKREGGTFLQGWVYGGQICYEYIKRNRMYWGVEANVATGRITGHNSIKNRLKSVYTDANVEARMGYTFQQKCGYQLLFTPYLGGGAAVENNHFVNPSPMHVHFRLYYGYICTGFLSQMSCGPCFDAGLNFKAKLMLDAKNRVSHDPCFDSSTSLVGNEVLYRVELPISYRPRPNGIVCFEPFYEFRHYGSHAGYPFDFRDTKLNLYGLLLKFIYLF